MYSFPTIKRHAFCMPFLDFFLIKIIKDFSVNLYSFAPGLFLQSKSVLNLTTQGATMSRNSCTRTSSGCSKRKFFAWFNSLFLLSCPMLFAHPAVKKNSLCYISGLLSFKTIIKFFISLDIILPPAYNKSRDFPTFLFMEVITC